MIDKSFENLFYIDDNKTNYLICDDDKNCGFFAMYRRWLEYLYFADMRGLKPYIFAGEDFCYHEGNGFLDTDNAYEYYFVQKKVNLYEHSGELFIHSEPAHRELVQLALQGKTYSYGYNDNYLNKMAETVRKYVSFNDSTSAYIDSSFDKLELGNAKVLGVHYRGTDYRVGYNRHPAFVERQQYFEAIDELIKKNGYDRIFLATDDKQILEDFKERYGTEILKYFEDTFRSDDTSSVVFKTANREHNKYKLGLEVLRDMITLSRCDGFVSGVSQVSVCARINKLASDESYDDDICLDNGIVSSNHNFYSYNSMAAEKKQDETADNLKKFSEFYFLLVHWLKKNIENRAVDEYFKAHGYRRIAIYGMKELGQLLCEELKESEIEVAYGIDRNAADIKAEIPIVTPNGELNGVDAIVVTAVHYYLDIKANLEKKVACPIVNLDEVLFWEQKYQ